jgi:RNA polymerase-interacting CarD/CdnL/TRCF family regulator
MYKIGTKIIYPGFGRAKIISIEKRDLLIRNMSFYRIEIKKNNVLVMVPVNNVKQLGITKVKGV